jgi:hypothetical protein
VSETEKRRDPVVRASPARASGVTKPTAAASAARQAGAEIYERSVSEGMSHDDDNSMFKTCPKLIQGYASLEFLS